MNTNRYISPRTGRYTNFAGSCCALLIAAFLVGCSAGSPAGSGTNPSPTPTPTAKTTIQVSMGDAPADWMLAFSMNINSMSLTGGNGTVNVVSSPTPIEMMHLMGIMQPLAMISVPQGTYTGASVTIGSATVMYMDPTSKTVEQKTISGPMTGTVTLSSSVTVGSTPMAMGFDLDLAHSVTVDDAGNMSMNPVFHMASSVQGSGNPMDFSDGGIQQMMGMLSSVSANSFAMSSMQAAQTFTFGINSSTKFDGTTMSGMMSGMLVMVDASLQSDGSLMATHVQSMMNSGGAMGGGIITAVTGQRPTSLAMVMQNGAGTSMMSSDFASGVNIDLSGTTTFKMDQDNVDMSGLPFTPAFDADHIYVGQSVMPISSSGMMNGGMGGMMGGGSMAGTINASELLLTPQGLSGTVATAVASGATTSFVLNLPVDCAFTALTGAKNVAIFQQAGTTLSATSPVAAGSTMHVFGMLFYDAGQWKMVASRLGTY